MHTYKERGRKRGERGKGSSFPFFFKFPASLFLPASSRRLHFKQQLGRPGDRETHCRAVGGESIWEVGGTGWVNNSVSDFSCLRQQFLLRLVIPLHTRLGPRPSIAPAYHPGMPPAAATAAACRACGIRGGVGAGAPAAAGAVA